MSGLDVYKAINAVQGELAKTGIAKDRKNEMQGYKFRGIDEVYNALAPLLAKHGLVVLPRVTGRECVERTSAKGAALFYVTVHAEFDFVAASDGSKHTIVTYGEAMDSGDKATNKAMSAAYKYAAMQAFAIPTEGDNDADAQTHEVAAKPRDWSAPVTGNSGGITPHGTDWEDCDAQTKEILAGLAVEVGGLLMKDDVAGALARIAEHDLSVEQKVALNTRFDSKQRTKMRKHLDANKSAPA